MSRGLFLLVLCGSAAAGDRGVPLVVDVGKTVERAVANANGWFCDDPSLVDATVVTRDDINYWRVTGVEAGSTQCRVGTDATRYTVVFDVTVKVPPRKPR